VFPKLNTAGQLPKPKKITKKNKGMLSMAKKEGANFPGKQESTVVRSFNLILLVIVVVISPKEK
jgi:hypothetical protein